LALWLKGQKFKLDQVQNFYPSPMANATTIYHTELNSLKNVKHDSEQVTVPKKGRQRKLHKFLLRYHDPVGWPMIREALVAMGKESLIGNGPQHLVPPETRNEQTKVKWGQKPSAKAKEQGGQKAMTRFSADQFEDRKGNTKADKTSAKPAGQKPKSPAKASGQAPKSQGTKRPAKATTWATKSKYAK
jgi:hypothetical protein